MVSFGGNAWRPEMGAFSTHIQLLVMTIEYEFFKKEQYLRATITSSVITLQSAKTVFKSIHDECKELNCQKVLLDEMTVEKRAIASHKIRELAEYFPKMYIAFLCRPYLINKETGLFSAFTFSDTYMVKFFSNEAQALSWLMPLSRF